MKYPHIHVKLVGENGNANVLIAKVASTIRRVEGNAAATAFVNEAMSQGSYDELLQFIMDTVDVQ